MRHEPRFHPSRLWRGFVGYWRRHPRIFYTVFGTLALIVGFQLVFPGDHALPFARINGDMVGLASHQEIAKKLSADYGKVDITTRIRGKQVKTPLAKTGVAADNEQILKGVSDYPWYYRILPLSIFVKGALSDQAVVTRVDGPRFSLYATERGKECTVAPKNAGVIVKNGEVEIDPAKDGQACSQESLKRQLTAVSLEKSGIDVTIKTTAVKPERSDKDVEPLLKEARKIAEHKLTLVVAEKTYAIDKPTLASWLAFPEDPNKKTISVGINDEAVKTYLATIQKDVYIAPGTTVITTLDSIEQSRVTGRSGRGIDMNVTTEGIRKQVLAGDGTVTATLAVLSPNLSYNRSYSKTPEGLQALVNDLVKDKGDFAISVRKLGDSGVHANGDKQYHPASTYKLFVAYSVLKRVDSGQMSLGQTTSGGQTLAQCLDNMIVNSDNACAEWFGSAIGWNTLTNEARAIGASRTTLSRPFVSTANDMALFLQKLESNQLGLSEPSRARLIDAMKRQVFRKGIPAGVGVPVADKVGFLEGYLHDAAIVYSPSGVYVLVIYSNGSSWGAIADAARQIQTQLQ
jgi:beta-lactamase class A